MTEIANSATTTASQRWTLFSGATFHLPGVPANEAYGGSHLFTLPAFPLPVTAGWISKSLGFLPGFTPRRYQRRMPGAGTGVEHSPGANRRPYSTLHSDYLTCTSATSRRTAISW